DLVIAVVGAGNAQGEVVENALVEPVHHREPVRGGEIDPRLPLRRGYVDARLDRFQKHGLSPVGILAVNSATPAAASIAAARIAPNEAQAGNAADAQQVRVTGHRIVPRSLPALG